MLRKRMQYTVGKRFGFIAPFVIAFVFVLSGFGTASAFPWNKSSETPAVAPERPGSLAELVKRLSPTVVNIKVTKVEKTGSLPMGPEGPFGDFFKQFPGLMPQIPESKPVQGAGSGVIISADGYILTNNHVVEGAKEVVVTLNEKDEYTAQVVGRDPKTDLAVVKIQPRVPLQAAGMGNSDALQVGDSVMAIGNPFGLGHTVTSGIVSAKGRVIGAGPYDNFIQTDASINPGNSGGPLYNMNGDLVGINTAIIPNGQGIGFAIPINTAKPLIPQLVAKGEVIRGFLGVNVQTLTPELAKGLNVKEAKGALVAGVTPESPAEKGGIHRGDVIVSYNQKPVEEARDLSGMVAETPVGEHAVVTVLRNGVRHDLKVTVGAMEPEKTAKEETVRPTTGKWGLQLRDLDQASPGGQAGHGVAVVGVKSGTPADRAGIRQGDVILEVNQKFVNSAKEAVEAISRSENPDSLVLLVQRENGSFYIAFSA